VGDDCLSGGSFVCVVGHCRRLVIFGRRVVEESGIHVENLLESIRNSWKHKGVTIVSDGGVIPKKGHL